MSRPAKVLLLGALFAVAALATACGTQKISVPKSAPSLHQGAVLFNQRCSGCHTLSYAAARGSAQNVRTAQINNGPNFDVRCERPVARVLYAIENGGFSGVIMPQNIVVGQQARDVAQFVATYSGRKAPKVPGVVVCEQVPIGSIDAALATPPTATTATTATTTTGPSAGTVTGTTKPGSTTTSSTATSSTTASSTTTSPTATSAAGKSVFTSAGCGSCHTLAAAGATGTIGPNLDTRLRTDCDTAGSKRIRGATLTKCIHTAITDPYAYLPSGYQAGIMPNSFGKTLTPTQLQALVSFLQSSAK